MDLLNIDLPLLHSRHLTQIPLKMKSNCCKAGLGKLVDFKKNVFGCMTLISMEICNVPV